MKLVLIRISSRIGKSSKTGNDYSMYFAHFLTAADRKLKNEATSFEQFGYAELETLVNPDFYPQLEKYWKENFKGTPLVVDVELQLGSPNVVTGFLSVVSR